jgi:hypothetical protein
MKGKARPWQHEDEDVMSSTDWDRCLVIYRIERRSALKIP